MWIKTHPAYLGAAMQVSLDNPDRQGSVMFEYKLIELFLICRNPQLLSHISLSPSKKTLNIQTFQQGH